jgi:hypothetical protein
VVFSGKLIQRSSDLNYSADFVSDIDFANQPFKPLIVSAEGIDVYVMGSNLETFGSVSDTRQDSFLSLS